MKHIRILFLLLLVPLLGLARTPIEKPRLVLMGSTPHVYFGMGFEFEREQLWNNWFKEKSEMTYWGNFSYRTDFDVNKEFRSKFSFDPQNHEWTITMAFDRYDIPNKALNINVYNVEMNNVFNTTGAIQTSLGFEYMNRHIEGQKDHASAIVGLYYTKMSPLLLHANAGISQRGRMQAEAGFRFGQDFLSTPMLTFTAGYWMKHFKMDTSINYQFFSGFQLGIGHERFLRYHNTYLAVKMPLTFF